MRTGASASARAAAEDIVISARPLGKAKTAATLADTVAALETQIAEMDNVPPALADTLNGLDGNDLLAVLAAARAAVARARRGEGPTLLELKTYRTGGHFQGDPCKYRTREEVQEMRENRDPIDGAKAELLKRGVTEDRLKEIEKQIRSIVNEAADFAENSPEPELSELYTDILVESY